MATGYWRGADNATWNTTTNWWTTIGGTTTVATVPGAGEIAFFNANGTTTARTVYLNSSRSLGTFWMNGNAQGDITLRGGVSGGETTQTLTLGGIDMSGTSANAIFSSSVNVALANAQSWSIGSGRAILVSGVISGAFKLTSNNSGVIILGNANTYSGGTDISAGTVRAGNNQALGTGAGSIITMTGGTLSSDSTSARTLANALSLNGTMTLGDATNTGALTFSGTTTLLGNTSLTIPSAVTLSGVVAGAFNFTKAGANTLTLGAANTVSGTTQVTAGTLTLSNVNGLQNSTVDWGTSTVGTLSLPASAVLGGLSTASGTLNTFTQNGAYSVGNNNASATFGGVLAGTGAITKVGTGSWTLTGNNTNSGAVSVSAGTLNANSATALGAASSTAGISVTSGTTLSLGAALNYSSPGRTTTISGTGVSTGGALVHAYAGTANVGSITLGAASYVRGTTTGALSSTFALGTNRLTAGAASGITFNLSGTLTSTSPAGLTVGGQASDTGTVVVSGSNTLPGAFFVNYGTLSTQNAQALGITSSALSGTVDIGATLSVGVLATYTGSITLNGSIVIAHSGASNLGTITSNFNTAYVRGTVLNAALASPFSVISDLTFGAAASASLALTGVINSSASNVVVNVGQQVADTGTVFFNANNTYAGTTTLAYGTAQVVTNQNGSVSGPLGKSGTIRFTGGTLQYSATNQLDYSPRLDTAGNQQWKIDTNGQTVTFAAVLQGASSSLTKSGTGTLVLSGANTYSGGSDLGAGTTQAGNTQAFGTSGTVTLTASGAALQTLTTGGQNGKLTVASLNNAAGGTIKIGG